jgi:hypothetical protein|tara:strand:- start:4749 stop:5879 length:1131 start_codon:yes stop_codon:yes gene_type:complete
MKITLKRTDEQIELIKAMASKNKDVAYEAQAALAEFMAPVVAEVINQAPVLSNLFSTFSFDADSNPSLPLDLYYDITAEDYIQVYSTTIPGGLPTNHVLPTASELKFTTYTLDSAVSFDRRYAAQSRLDVVGKTMTRVAQEVLMKQQTTSASLVMGSLAAATTPGVPAIGAGTAGAHVQPANIAGQFLLADLNAMLTRAKRANAAWTKGTPVGGEGNAGITDVMVSPEVVEQIRAMSYNPVNTQTSAGSAPSSQGAAWIAAPESVRSNMWGNAGLPTFYGINIMEVNELGVGGRFTNVYDAASPIESATGKDLVVGLNLSKDSLLRAVALDSESGAEFTLMADDQYSIRQQKIGFFGSVEEGRMVIDTRALFGVVV